MANNSSTIEGDFVYRGSVRVLGSLTVADGAIQGTAINPSSPIPAARAQHAHRAPYAQGSGSNAAAATQVIHLVVGATGTVQAFRAGSVAVAVGAATATIDLKKNGASILTAVVTLNSSNAARVSVAGTIASPNVVAGDLLEVVITATAGGGTLAQGVFAFADIFEDAT